MCPLWPTTIKTLVIFLIGFWFWVGFVCLFLFSVKFETTREIERGKCRTEVAAEPFDSVSGCHYADVWFGV